MYDDDGPANGLFLMPSSISRDKAWAALESMEREAAMDHFVSTVVAHVRRLAQLGLMTIAGMAHAPSTVRSQFELVRQVAELRGYTGPVAY